MKEISNIGSLEPQLKLLYTAITRTCERLIFLESKSSCYCASIYFRRLRSIDLAEPLQTESFAVVENFKLMTADEWRVRGLDLILSCDDENNLNQSDSFYVEAIKCFRNAGDMELLNRAEILFEMYNKSSNYMTNILTLSTEVYIYL